MTTNPSEAGVPHPADAELFRLFSAEGQRDPFPSYARLRALAPVHVSEALGGAFVTGYDAACAVLSGEKFGTVGAEWFDKNQPGWRDSPLLVSVFSSLAGANSPDHTRLRRLVARAFNVRQIEQVRPYTAQLTEQALDAMAERADSGEVPDVPSQLALPVTMGTIARLVGVPPEDLGPFDTWIRKAGVVFEMSVPPEVLAEADAAYTHVLDYFTTLVAERRKSPGDDLLSALIAVRDADGDRLGAQELVDLLAFVFGSGFETTAGLIGNTVVTLAAHPDQMAALRTVLATSPDKLGPVIDELGRFDGSVQATRRMALEDVEVGGVTIPAGTATIVFLGGANRDPARFPDPDRLDLHRADARPLNMGLGVHYCLGAALARLEMEEVLRRLYGRHPHLRLADTPVRTPGLQLYRYESIPVALN